jgi:pimeloyl-ACP methyl ester carboxylesterase
MVGRIFLFALFAPVALAAAQSTGADARISDVEFVSHGVRLSGSLALPREGKVHAAVVFIHGSGQQTRNLSLAGQFAGQGIAALVYDKRGAGKSAGAYESEQSVSEENISLLTDDAVSALNALASHPGLEGVPLGLTGISQAGWIAPLAAARSKRAAFLVLWSGPVCKVSEEDIYSKYTRDSDRQTVPPYRQALDARTEKYIWPDFLGRDTDSSEDLARLTIPGLWIFSDNDASIPVDLSIERLQSLRRSHRYDYVLFSGLGHNNMGASFATATDWIKRLSK